jgi:hypothetical protein
MEPNYSSSRRTATRPSSRAKSRQFAPPRRVLRSMYGVVLATLFPLALATLWSGDAHATTFDDATIEELVRASDVIVRGRVEAVVVEPNGPSGQRGIHTRAIVRVDETIRGDARELVEVWVHGGQLGRRMRVVPGQATFREGEEVVLFLFEAGGGLWPTGMGRGKWVREPSGEWRSNEHALEPAVMRRILERGTR